MDEAKVMEVLRLVEWVSARDPEAFCPCCKWSKYDGHADNCKLAALLEQPGRWREITARETPEDLMQVSIPTHRTLGVTETLFEDMWGREKPDMTLARAEGRLYMLRKYGTEHDQWLAWEAWR